MVSTHIAPGIILALHISLPAPMDRAWSTDTAVCIDLDIMDSRQPLDVAIDCIQQLQCLKFNDLPCIKAGSLVPKELTIFQFMLAIIKGVQHFAGFLPLHLKFTTMYYCIRTITAQSHIMVTMETLVGQVS